jgi:DUF2075 family protein
MTLHPSDQVRGYVDYCSRFHSAVLNYNASVTGCVFFTSASRTDPYRDTIHNELIHDFPVFGRTYTDYEAMVEHITGTLVYPDEAFAYDFERGQYKQDRELLRQVSESIQDSQERPFVLLDDQRKGFHLAMDALARTTRSYDEKHVIIVNGPPGSGKSALAANLWAAAAEEYGDSGNVAFVTTSSAQKTNWEKLFTRVSGKKVAQGFVKPANSFNPGLNPNEWLKEMRDAGHKVEVETWRENLSLFERSGRGNKAPDNLYFLSVVDEAHALIDPTQEGKRGVNPSGWVMHAGPQAWHIIRASRISVFLLDGAQSYRDNETTTLDAIRHYASEHGATVQEVSLEDAQFRSGGSKEYMDWLDAVLETGNPERASVDWRKSDEASGGLFEFEIVSSPNELDSRLAQRIQEGHSARLASSYSRPWNSKGYAAPHQLPESQRDFRIETNEGTWSRVWNFTPGNDYSVFIQAPEDSVIGEQPLAEVGCPYVIRGFDYDYLGVLWLEDLVRRNGRWKVNIEHVHESAWRNTLAQAKRKGEDSSAHKELLEKLLRGYRILLSRAIKGVYLYISDNETRQYIQDKLNENQSENHG